MATQKIRGLTVEIGADTTGLKSALKETNKQVGETASALKEVNKLLKLDPTNIDLLTQKQKLLNKQVENNETKLKALKDAQKEFAEAAANGNTKAQQTYDALQTEIIAVEGYLQKAKDAASSFNVEAEIMSAKINDFGNKAQVVADKTKLLSAAGVAVAGSLGAMAVKAMHTADDLNTLATQTGFSTEELQRFSYAADRVDVSTETITGAVRKLKSNMGGSGAVFNELGISIKNADGSMRDATDVFYDSLEALSRISNETERDTAAMQLFGKSADSLATIIDDGGKKLKELGDQATIWTQESIDAANAVNDLVDGLKADAQQTILVTGAKALENLQPLIETIINALSGLLNIIANMDSSTIAIIGTIALLVAAISPIAGLIAQISFAASGLITILPMLTPIIAAVTAVAPWIALIAAVGVFVAAIIASWDAIKASAKEFINTINNTLIQPIKDYIADVKGRFDAFWDGIKERAETNINAIIGFVNSAIEKINALTGAINNSFIGSALGLNIGQIGTIPSVGGNGVMTANRAASNVSTSNTTINNITQASSQPIELQVNLDSAVLARQMYEPNAWESTRRGSAAFSR